MQIFINTYGTYLHVKDNMFEIKVREDRKQPFKVNHIAAHKVTSFIVSKGAALASDAIALALKHNIDIVVVENNGHPMGRFWHSKLGSTTKIRKEQLKASMNKAGVEVIKEWLGQKLENQADFLQDLKKHRTQMHVTLDEKIASILEFRQNILNSEAQSIKEVDDSFRGWEGSAGRQYFDALSQCMPE